MTAKKKGRSVKPRPSGPPSPALPGQGKRTRRTDTAPLRVEGFPAIRLRVSVYDIVDDAVRDASLGGWRRANEYGHQPREEEAAQVIADAIMLALTEVLDFPDPYADAEG